MKSTGLVRRLAAAGAGVAMLATMAIGLTAGSASASTAAATSANGVYATTPVASPKHFEGECPADVTFTSKIRVRVDGKTTVAYRWLRGDGSKSKVKTLTVRGKGIKYVTVREKSTFKEDVEGWQKLQVLAPLKKTTKKGYFSVSCGTSDDDGDDAVVEERPNFAKAYVDVEDFSDVCTPDSKVTAEGRIRVGEPTWVKYRWIHNGEVVDYGKTKVYGAKKVYYSFRPDHSHKGWVTLDIVSPRYGGEDRDFYSVRCEKPAEEENPAKAWASVSGADDYTGSCPVDRTFDGTVSVNGRTVVKYRWAGPGYRGPVETLFFGKYGPNSKSVSHTVKATESGTVKRWIEILGPNHSGSNVGVAKVECGQPAPPAGKVTDVDVSASADNTFCQSGKAPGVNVTGTISVSGPASVSYRWEVNGQSAGGGTVSVQRSTSLNLKVDPAAAGTTTSGGVSLVVTAPNLERGGAHFSFTCPGKATA